MRAAPQGTLDFVENALPIPALAISEEPHRRIPGTVGTIEQPAPIGHPREGNPHRHRQRPARCAAAVSEAITRSRFFITAAVSRKRAQLWSDSAGSSHGKTDRGPPPIVPFPAPFCKTNQANSRSVCPRSEAAGNGAPTIVAVLPVSLPGDAPP